LARRNIQFGTSRFLQADADLFVHEARLMALYSEEVIPDFACCNMAHQATAYVAMTITQFQNTFLNHRLSDITQNHQLKTERRAVDIIKWVKLYNSSAKVVRFQQLIDRSQLRKI
jgi:tagaturonate reductase